MKITCPTNPEHETFVTVAHEVHDWKVDSDGEFLDDLGTVEITHGPTVGNTFECFDCGADAKAED